MNFGAGINHLFICNGGHNQLRTFTAAQPWRNVSSATSVMTMTTNEQWCNFDQTNIEILWIYRLPNHIIWLYKTQQRRCLSTSRFRFSGAVTTLARCQPSNDWLGYWKYRYHGVLYISLITTDIHECRVKYQYPHSCQLLLLVHFASILHHYQIAGSCTKCFIHWSNMTGHGTRRS